MRQATNPQYLMPAMSGCSTGCSIAAYCLVTHSRQTWLPSMSLTVSALHGSARSFCTHRDQGLPVALSQYAPGKEVWIDGRLWTSGAIFSPMPDESGERLGTPASLLRM